MTRTDTILDTIAQTQRVRLARDQEHESLAALIARGSRRAARPHDLAAALRQADYGVIAEVKLASPSEGDIAPNADPVAIASDYLCHGARALSVLTEPTYFKGSLDYLVQIRQAHPDAVLLMKDFVLDPYQIHQGHAAGCDAVLIIMAMLSEPEARALFALARDLGLSALVEVHDVAELDAALRLGATLIGVNNRNLKTMTFDRTLTEHLAPRVPPTVTLVAESGLSRAADLVRLRAKGCHGFLIGTAFMKTGTPGAALGRLLEECRHGG